MLPPPQKPRRTKLAITLATILIIASLIAGVTGYYIAHTAAVNSPKPPTQSSTTSSSSTQTDEGALTDNVSLPQIYQQVSSSVVVVEDFQPSTNFLNQVTYSQVLGSGFI